MKKLELGKNTLQGTFWGVLDKFINIVFPFILRTIIIRILGAEYAGLNSLYTSILQVLSLAELGIGSAMVYQMYKPVAEDDKKLISALLAYYKKAYYIIGIIILGIGLLICPFIKCFINGNTPDDINIYVLFLIYLGNTVLSYSFLAYEGSILSAYQREADNSKIRLCANGLMYVVQIILLVVFKNYYIYILFLPLATVLYNYLRHKYVRINYPDIKCEGSIGIEQKCNIKNNVLALFLHKIGAAVVNTIDTLVISTFMGLTIVSNYGNYYYLMSAVTSLITIAFTALTAGIGNVIITSDRTVVKKHFNLIFYCNGAAVIICTTCFFAMYQDFIALWVGDKYLFGYDTMMLFCLYFFIHTIRRTIIMYRDAAGMWMDNKWQPIFSSIINLLLNIILINIIGINGILLSTIISMILVDIPWETRTLMKKLLGENEYLYFAKIFLYLVITSGSCWVIWNIMSLISLDSVLIKLVLEGSLATLISLGLFLIFTFFFSERKIVFNKVKKWLQFRVNAP